MSVHLYKIDCLTNLHVGSGDINYNIIDNEVEKDINGYPIIHSSGLKGALREQAEKTALKKYKEKKAEQQNTETEETVKKEKDDPLFKQFMDPVIKIFGQESGSKTIVPGSYKFLDANIISRPLRVQGSDSMASISVFSLASINDYLAKITAFGVNKYGFDMLDEKDFSFETYEFISTETDIYIEGERAEVFSQQAKNQLDKLKDVLGEKYAVVKTFDHYLLPVLARNYLEDGKSKNLWYEEVVPHGSVFYTIIITPDDTNELDMDEIKQIGGHASIGCGFTKFTKLN